MAAPRQPVHAHCRLAVRPMPTVAVPFGSLSLLKFKKTWPSTSALLLEFLRLGGNISMEALKALLLGLISRIAHVKYLRHYLEVWPTSPACLLLSSVQRKLSSLVPDCRTAGVVVAVRR